MMTRLICLFVGIKLFVVGIGHINRWEELRKLATSKKFYFGFDTYNEYFDTVKKAVGGIKRRNRKG